MINTFVYDVLYENTLIFMCYTNIIYMSLIWQLIIKNKNKTIAHENNNLTLFHVENRST